MKKVTIQVSFEYECEVDALNDKDAFDKASDNAMDYLESICNDLHQFDWFWEYQINITHMKVIDC